jgi:hypothetical protein
MSLVVRKRHPMAMAMAVALEIGALRLLGRVVTAEAVDFNRRLWSLVRSCADHAADADGCGSMLAACAQAEAALAQEPRALELINRALAGILAGQYSSSGALRALILTWERERPAYPGCCFEDWLLEAVRRDTGAMAAAA